MTMITIIIITATIITTIMAMTITIIGSRPTTCAVGLHATLGGKESGRRSSRMLWPPYRLPAMRRSMSLMWVVAPA